MITKRTMAAAGLRPGELAQVIEVAAGTVSRYNPESPQHITPPAAVDALIYVLGQLPTDLRAAMCADLLAGRHRAES